MVPTAVDSGLGTVAGVARYLALFVIHYTYIFLRMRCEGRDDACDVSLMVMHALGV